MKILVTGSSGFIGFHLVKTLLALGHKVVGVDNHNDYYDTNLKLTRLNLLKNNNFKFYLQDLNNLDIEDIDFDIAINLAAQAGVRVSKEKYYLYKNSNIEGYKKFCNFCIYKKISNIIYASSSSVYSDESNEKYNEENTNLKPKSYYGKTKIENEEYSNLLAHKENLNFVGLRFFSVYGPYGRPDMAYYSFTDALQNNKEITLINDGNMYRDMTYIDDIIDGILKTINFICNSKNIKNEIFNLGNNAPISTLTLLKTLEQKLNKKGKIVSKKTNDESSYTHADITKAQNVLGYNPRTEFLNGIDKFLDWYKKNEI